ncbi:MAG: oxidoreductase [Anaerococcus hydrogenalis]|uniref:oxidoreductase n=1 Tax=Anaerococcus hydrogenalis TaxID=33029 RepID=UPI0029040CD2|nr:oxidoreductase [Anaerococcus hydrogenalis]MDU2582223.1 oxidoreductase [Anaerococcus hydrogenalis]
MRKSKKNNNALKLFRKNKYNIILLAVVVVISLILFSKLVNYISNRNLSNYDNEIFVIKNNDSEIDSLTLKDLRNLDSTESKVTFENGEEFSVVGISIENILKKEKINPNLNNIIEFSDQKGNKTNLSMETALEVNRVLLVYKINSKPSIEYNKKLGVLFALDKQDKDSSKWIKNIQTINIK